MDSESKRKKISRYGGGGGVVFVARGRAAGVRKQLLPLPAWPWRWGGRGGRQSGGKGWWGESICRRDGAKERSRFLGQRPERAVEGEQQ